MPHLLPILFMSIILGVGRYRHHTIVIIFVSGSYLRLLAAYLG